MISEKYANSIQRGYCTGAQFIEVTDSAESVRMFRIAGIARERNVIARHLKTSNKSQRVGPIAKLTNSQWRVVHPSSMQMETAGFEQLLRAGCLLALDERIPGGE